MNRSQTLWERAVQYLPGGVNSPVRAFQSVGGTPPFIKKADGAYLFDEDGRRYLDFVCSWGPMILGHNHPAVREAVLEAAGDGLSFGAVSRREVEMAELVCSMVPSVEMVRMVNSGTEAVMSAVRLSRGYTGRNKIVKFAGCYHGHMDALLAKAGSGVMNAGQPDSAGITPDCAQDTLVAVYNDLEGVRGLFAECGEEIAAVIVEPVAANMGVVLPEAGFLEGLRTLCDSAGSLLIFDEVITGFRLGTDGAQGMFGVRPDLTTFGKIIGAGMPVGAYGGRREIMEQVAPLGPVYQAGTLSGNPVAMSAGLALLGILKSDPNIYTELNQTGDWFFTEINQVLADTGAPCTLNHIGSLGCLFFGETAVRNYADAKRSDTKRFARYFHTMLEQGVYLAPSQFEAMFLSGGHTRQELSVVIEQMHQFLRSENI